VTLSVPPLRQRPEDVPLLVLHFLRRFARELDRPVVSLHPEALKTLQGYAWPGNVRELQNVIERGVLFCAGDTLRAADLPEPLRRSAGETIAPAVSLELDRPLPELLDAVEEELIRRALVKARGVQAQAAELLGISRSNLQYKLKKFGLDG
jgi:two-component system NtrC family response regulator